MIVLGIDPGLTKANPAGIAIVDTDAMRLIYSEALVYDGADWEANLDKLAVTLASILASRKDIEGVAYEYAHYQKNVQVTIKLSHAGGLVRGLAALHALPCVAVQPVQAKIALTGDRKAGKRAMIKATRLVFGAKVGKDEADAVGVALAGEAMIREAALAG
jgi:Holliday junction resolvasome RuvABC endonuclease subunit